MAYNLRKDEEIPSRHVRGDYKEPSQSFIKRLEKGFTRGEKKKAYDVLMKIGGGAALGSFAKNSPKSAWPLGLALGGIWYAKKRKADKKRNQAKKAKRILGRGNKTENENGKVLTNNVGFRRRDTRFLSTHKYKSPR